MGRQILRWGHHLRVPAFGTDVIETLGNHRQGRLHLRAIRSAAFRGARMALQISARLPQYALAMEPGDGHHLIQQGGPGLAIGLLVPGTHDAQILQAFVQSQLFYSCFHGYLR